MKGFDGVIGKDGRRLDDGNGWKAFKRERRRAGWSSKAGEVVAWLDRQVLYGGGGSALVVEIGEGCGVWAGEVSPR